MGIRAGLAVNGADGGGFGGFVVGGEHGSFVVGVVFNVAGDGGAGERRAGSIPAVLLVCDPAYAVPAGHVGNGFHGEDLVGWIAAANVSLQCSHPRNCTGRTGGWCVCCVRGIGPAGMGSSRIY